MKKTYFFLFTIMTFSFIIRGDLFVYSANPTDHALKTLFQNPGKEYRPLQIIHGFDGLIAPKYKKALDKNLMDELFQIATGIPTDSLDLKSALKQSLGELKDSGLGGVVCNVSFREYMRDENIQIGIGDLQGTGFTSVDLR